MPSKTAARSRKSKRPPTKVTTVPELDEHAAEYRGLSIFLRQTRTFRLALALYNDPVAREGTIRSLIGELAEQGVQVLTLDLRQPASEHTLLARIEALVKGAEVKDGEQLAVMVVNMDSQVDYTPELMQPSGLGTAFLETANLHRELFPGVCPGPLVLWMTELLERAFVGYAPDLWHWRSHVFDLRTRVVLREPTNLSEGADWHNDDYRRHPADRLHRLEEELAAYRKAGMFIDQCRVLNALGIARFDAGDARAASHDFEMALTMARQLSEPNAQASALCNLGLTHAQLGETRKAIGFYEQALVINREIGNRRGEANALGNLGNAYARLGETRKAIDFHEQALAIDREIGDRKGEGEDLGNLGNAHARLGEMRKAIDFRQQRLVIAREIGDRRGEANALGNLGNAYADLGETHKAIDFQEQALAIDREIGNRIGEGNVLGGLGNAYVRSGEMSKAIDLYEQRLIIAREIGDRHGEANALGNLGNAYALLGETHKAIGLYEQQLSIARETGDLRGEGQTLYNSANEFRKIGDLAEGIRRAEAALDILESIEYPGVSKIRAWLAQWQS